MLSFFNEAKPYAKSLGLNVLLFSSPLDFLLSYLFSNASYFSLSKGSSFSFHPTITVTNLS